MKLTALLAPLFILSAMTLSAAAADSTVTLSDVHLCCGKCVTGVATAIKPVTGAKAVCDQTAKTVVITAPDAATVQKTVDALIAAGYFGKSSDAAIKIDAATGAPDAKVASLDISGLHLCCNTCITAVNAIFVKVPGITANTAKVNAATFTVTGNFNAKTLMDEFQKAGLTGKVTASAAAK